MEKIETEREENQVGTCGDRTESRRGKEMTKTVGPIKLKLLEKICAKNGSERRD
jgi:hypothetical protein